MYIYEKRIRIRIRIRMVNRQSCGEKSILQYLVKDVLNYYRHYYSVHDTFNIGIHMGGQLKAFSTPLASFLLNYYFHYE